VHLVVAESAEFQIFWTGDVLLRFTTTRQQPSHHSIQPTICKSSTPVPLHYLARRIAKASAFHFHTRRTHPDQKKTGSLRR
jgi:hypothetical protein